MSVKKIPLLAIVIIWLLSCAAPLFTFAQSVPDYIIYETESGKKVDLDRIIKKAKKHKVIFFGEEHNDSIAHVLQYELFVKLHKKHKDKAVLSMEMFSRDVQYILDEYLNGQIKESYFNKDSRQWNNYEDYKPMVEYAKTNGLKVIAANAPFRYVNMAANKGQKSLEGLSSFAKKAMAPLPYKTPTGAYKEKLLALMGHTSSPSDTTTTPHMTYDILQGQSLWDATMAYSIHEHLKSNKKCKILHLNGRFHTDERFGIVEQLKGYNSKIKTLVISSSGSEENYPNIDFEQFKHLGDYVIFTNPKIKKTY